MERGLLACVIYSVFWITAHLYFGKMSGKKSLHLTASNYLALDLAAERRSARKETGRPIREVSHLEGLQDGFVQCLLTRHSEFHVERKISCGESN